MLSSGDAPNSKYMYAWAGLLVVFLYYVIMMCLLRRSPGPSTKVIKYEPPPSLSPAIAGYLFENGRSERAFAAALVSLAVKGYLEIQETKDWFTLKRLRERDASLAPEESTALLELFPSSLNVCKFDGRENSSLYRAFEKFEFVVEHAAEPGLISPHDWIWAFGAGCLSFIAALLAFSIPIRENRTSLGSIAYVSIWVFLGGYCLVAALRLWPATISRLASFLPNSKGPKRPLGWNDMFPLWLTATTTLAFGFLAAVTSPRFAIFIVAAALLAFTFRHVLEAPTKQGRKLISELLGFRDFLSRTDSDRLARNNEVGATPGILERHLPYAVALNVEHGWGEEFTTNLLEMLQFDRAVDYKAASGIGETIVNNIPARDDESIIQLNLGAKK
jgi:Predicted membrane protein (DUF2207)